ncbi:zinc ribbon domain-containing protein [Oceanobacillus halophilus]|uniref:Zinc-ribbon domain-containing protein n=1 Tax=Oceanobacillus halophilus TaxID=930130 RepID=A0A495AB84_9BACI|nr:zinc ribbon domain-containing protein [Oceanobacillus halophilus]RKQ37327.1 zinc-ribbon domain-containing protein [Oceanobacillus halophilus]
MYYCPNCGSSVKEDEHFCVNCGKKLPTDIDDRMNRKKPFNKYWIIPIVVSILVILTFSIIQLLLQNRIADAKDFYNSGEEKVLEGNYDEAIPDFEQAIQLHSHFPQAQIALDFASNATSIEKMTDDAKKLSDEQEFQEALAMLNSAENNLKNYKGAAVNELINQIKNNHDEIKIAELSNNLDKNPSIDELKTLLWDAEAVGKKAEGITETIRSQIIDYSFSKASELITNNHFSDAYLFVEDALKYAPDSEKLNSLKTTIDKEKTAFETAQQNRIEQAMTIAQADQEFNETDAVSLVSANTEKDDSGNITVVGEVESVATIPINSVLVKYSLLSKSDTEILSNEVFVYPDTLYPEEKGNFEFTHYKLTENVSDVKLKVDKITWYTD